MRTVGRGLFLGLIAASFVVCGCGSVKPKLGGGTDASIPPGTDASISPGDASKPTDGSKATDGSVSDAFVAHDALAAPSGHALVPGGTSAESTSYFMIQSAGQSPGGNTVRKSASYKMVGGLVGATQK
jgi:hypothetical protein